MNTDIVQANLTRYAQTNEFYAVRCEFFPDHREHISCTLFFRPQGQHRQAAYCLALYQYQYNARFACVKQSLQEVLDTLAVMNCSPDSAIWQEVDREQLPSQIAPSDLLPLWRSGYGVTRNAGDFQTTAFTAWAGVDIAF